MRKGGGVSSAAGANLFLEGFHIVKLIIDKLASVGVSGAFQHGLALRTVCSVIFTDDRSTTHIILHLRNFTVGTIDIGEAIGGSVRQIW